MAAGQTFKVLIEQYVGETDDDTALNSFLTATANEVQDALDKEEKLAISKSVEITSSNATSFDTRDKKILQVLKDADLGSPDNVYVMAQKVNITMQGKVNNANSIYAAEEYTPYWYIEQSGTGAERLRIVPTPTDSKKGKVYYLDRPDVSHSASAFTSGQLSNNALTAVILGASIRWLERKLSEVILDDGDGEVAQALTANIDILSKQYSGEMQRLSKVKQAGD